MGGGGAETIGFDSVRPLAPCFPFTKSQRNFCHTDVYIYSFYHGLICCYEGIQSELVDFNAMIFSYYRYLDADPFAHARRYELLGKIAPRCGFFNASVLFLFLSCAIIVAEKWRNRV